ncbi:family 43 glycosylhydrolase [Microbacterium sp. Clip185]|uniref:family 43 glycosylhydrolase n=1 Tax=Microbacterium sp. Clip185 TaxID=3025663 RepID=UPI002366D6B9|nr:family 43 glycosylhydrolase [Microbacterium sp. Clip185]WDG17286.1 family 43 glycosylhydrolase [Microbacterium sp. Clip185]
MRARGTAALVLATTLVGSGLVGAASAQAADPVRTSIASVTSASVAAATEAAPAPVASFDFETPPQAGAFASADARAVVQGTADLVTSREGQGTAARLSPAFWLTVTRADGTALLAGDEEVTISYDSLAEAQGNVGWTVFAAADASTQTYGSERYLGVLDRAGDIVVERYNNTGVRDTSGILTATGTSRWRHVDLVLAQNTARLYVDKQLVDTRLGGPSIDEILGTSGGILQIGRANWAGGEYFSGLLDNLEIYDRALTPAELDVEGAAVDDRAALGVPSVVLGDLPRSVRGQTVVWSATGPGAARVSPDGAVDTAGLHDGVAVRLEARVAGATEPLTWDVTLQEPGGEIASYVKKVTTVNGVKDDPLAYDDDRRADSLYVAARPVGSDHWQPLNRGQAILSVLWDDTQAAKPWAQMGSPSLFRDADGHLGVVASQNDSTSRIYVWRSTDNRTFTDQEVVDLGSGIVSAPRLIAAPGGGYQVRWTDLASGEGLTATISALDWRASVSAATRADVHPLGVDGDGLPAWAADAASAPVTEKQFSAFVNAYVDLQNTGVEAIDARVASGADAATVAAALPPTATYTYNDGSSKSLPVTWSAEQIADAAAAGAGTYEITGAVQQHEQRMVSDARADPHVFYNEDDGYYYLTGSHYAEPSDGRIDEASSYRKIGLKRARTLEGLAAAPEHIVIDPDNGTVGREAQYPNTFFGWGGFIWAQEFHKINGHWWIVAGMNLGFAQTGGWCDNTVLIPYTGDEASIRAGGFFDEANWGEPTVLEGAAFDVSYFERTENGSTQGYWIMPNGGRLLVAKARMGDGVVPLLDGAPTTIYTTSQVWERGKQAPTPADTNEGSDQAVVEAPYMLQHGDRIYVTYSGGTVDKYYSLGLLTASADAALTDPASWTQTAFPILDTNDTYQGRLSADESTATRETAGTGHNALIADANGNLLLAYHARPYPDPHTVTDPAGAGGLFDPDRNTWFQSVNVRADGRLDLSLTKDQEVAPENRTVVARVTIAAGQGPTPTTEPTPTAQPTSPPAPTARATASAAQVTQGGSFTVSVSGLGAGEQVRATLHSEPMVVAGIPIADASGAVTFLVRVPSDFALGAHQLIVTRADGSALTALPIEVVKAHALAASGLTGSPLTTGILACLLIVMGIMVRVTRRRAA